MSLAKGTASSVVYKEEAALNEVPVNSGAAARYLSFVSESFGGNINQVVSEEIRSDRAVAAVRGGNISAGGTITTEFGPFKNGIFLKHLMGKAPTAWADRGPDLDVYDATKFYNRGNIVRSVAVSGDIWLCTKGGNPAGAFDDAENTAILGTTEWQKMAEAATSIGVNVFTPQTTAGAFLATGLTFEKMLKGGVANSFIQFGGVRVNSVTFNIQQEGIVRADWAMLAHRQYNMANVFTGAPAIGAASTDQPFIGADCVVYMGRSAAATLLDPMVAGDAAENTLLTPRPIREATITISNQFSEDINTIGERFRREVPEGVRQISGSFTSYFENADEFEAFLGEETVTLEFVFICNSKMVVIRLPYVKISGDGTPKISGPGVLTGTYNFTAFKLGAEDDVKISIWGVQADALV
jgi:hypothetical protein